MKLKALSITSLALSTAILFSSSTAHAECASYTRRETGSLVTLPIYKYQVGSSAFANLMNLGFDEAGRIIGSAHDWLGDCSYPSIGISASSGSGEMVDGIYPNDASVVYAIYGGGINLSVARSAIYTAISASSDPVPPATTTTTTTTVANSAPPESSPPSETTTTVPYSPAPLTISVTEENDGVVELDYAELIVNKVGTRYQIQIDSSYQNQSMKIRARISNRRTITWNITTDSNGYKGFSTSRNLAGFTVSLWILGERFDTVGVR